MIDGEASRSRIGIDPGELPEALEVANEAAITVTGLHMYAGTNTRRVSRYLECLERLLAAAELLPELEYVNVGGGYGIGYREGQTDLDIDAVAAQISHRMKSVSCARRRPIRLVLEPGRSLVATAGSLLVTVVSVKYRDDRRYIGVDSTVGNIVVPSIYHGHHRVESMSAPAAPALAVPTDICGNTTHSRDFLARDIRLPRVVKGDVLALRDVGAYAYAMSSHFLNRPRPAEVVLDGESAILTTRRETLADLLTLQQPLVA
jgi:diaminopimelate decarboxylase